MIFRSSLGFVDKADVHSVYSSEGEDDVITWEPYGTMTHAQFNRRVWRNVFTLSLAFMLNYVSYGGLSNLQSSLHQDEGKKKPHPNNFLYKLSS